MGSATTAASLPISLPTLSDRALWYLTPATNWETQALPIGNARLGAKLYGGVSEDRVQFNEQSLWGGANNYDNALAGQPDSAFDLSMNAFGCYKNFGELVLAIESPSTDVFVGSPSGHTAGTGGTSIAATTDTDAASVWRVEPKGAAVVWQATFPSARQVSSYAVTSGSDAGADPGPWTLEGSSDGVTWRTLDTRSSGGGFTERGQTTTFTLSTSGNHTAYRLTLKPRSGTAAVEVGGISLAGAGFSTASMRAVVNYRRALDPRTGLHVTSFGSPGSQVLREAFTSREDDVVVLRYESEAPGGIHGTLSLTSAQENAPTRADAASRSLSWASQMGNKLRHAAMVKVAEADGTVAVKGTTLVLSGCSVVTLILGARTNYKLSAAAGWRGPDPQPILTAEVTKASGTAYDTLRSRALEATTAIGERISVDWGSTPADIVAGLPTDARLARYQGGAADPTLEQTMFTYGRYLLMSSSRPGGLPANLQGLWNQLNTPPWASDYHTNINVQMNYWGAETTNLPDSHSALIDFIGEVAVPSRVATRNAFGDVRGWTARTSQSVFGGNSWEWNTVASAWYMQHVYEHWAFNQDLTYLRETALPRLKEICQFWEDRLVEHDDGLLYSPNGWSPEHGPREDGVMYDQQIIWDLFQNYLDLEAAVESDPEYRAVVTDLQKRLAGNKIGRWGQLQEWQVDRDDPNNIHRHTSHLFAVYPGRQITPDTTPELAAAALVSLKARCGEKDGVPFSAATVSGDSRRSWTWPWRAALFARLRDGFRAGEMVRGLLIYNTLDNLWANHPPFQLDGNFGIVGGIGEMLLQSHTGVIELLPAIPKGWADGSFTGLRARGGYAVSCTWRGGRVVSYEVVADRARNQGNVKVRVNGQVVKVKPVNPRKPPKRGRRR